MPALRTATALVIFALAALAAAVPADAAMPQGSLQIHGGASVGAELRADASGITDADGGVTAVSFHWRRVVVAWIHGKLYARMLCPDIDCDDLATGETYLLTSRDLDKFVGVLAVITDGEGNQHLARHSLRKRIRNAGVSASVSALRVPEGGSGAYEVALESSPEGTVTVDITGTDGTDVSVSPARLTFTADDWSTARTVTVSVAADADDVADPAVTLMHRPSGGGYDNTGGDLVTVVPGEEDGTLTATVSNVPPWHASSSFTFRVSFNREVAVTEAAMRDEVFVVTGGSVSSATRSAPPSNAAWRIEVAPQPSTDVTVSLPAPSSCAAAGAVCTAGGLKLAAGASFAVRDEWKVGNVTAYAGRGEVQVRWALLDDAASYRVQWIRGDQSFSHSAADGQELEVSGTSTQVWIAGLIPGQSYTFRVIGVAADGLLAMPSDTDWATPMPQALTATLGNAPASHDGSTAFTIELHFSEEIRVSYRKLRDTALEVSGGTVRRARRLERGSNIGWRITIEPDTDGDIAIALPARACGATGAVCTTDDQALSEAVSATVPGPASQIREVSISAANSSTTRSLTPAPNSVPEGMDALFTLTRTGSLVNALTVGVNVTETGAMLDGAPPSTVTFDADSATAQLGVPTEDDEVAESAGAVTAALAAGSGYSLNAGAASATVTVEDDDAAPAITSSGPFTVNENATPVATLTATDDDTPVANLAWSIAGGADAASFALSAHGDLAFAAAKDFEAPDDADQDGDYEVTVRVTDGANPVDATLTVRLADVDEAAPVLSSARVDGASLTLTFGEPLDAGAPPASDAFSVDVEGAARGVSDVSISGRSVTLTLASAVVAGETVTVGYTAPAGANARPLRDAADNVAPGFSDRAVTNATPASNVAPAGLPAISGTARVGETLTASQTGIADDDGLTNATFAWQWIANDGTADADIAGATEATHVLTAAEAGKTVKVRVTFTDDGGAEETLVSEATTAVAAALPVVSVAAVSSPVTEGTAAAFRLERTGAVASPLTVSVSVTEAGAVVSGALPSTVTFAAGSAEAVLSVATEDDGVAEADGRVTATVSAGTGYTVASGAGAAGVDVYDNDESVSTSVETLWTSTLEWQGDYGNGWVNADADDFSSPDWSEDGNACRIWYLAYGSASRELWLRVNSDLCAGGIPEPETLTLHLGDVTVGPGDALSTFARRDVGIATGVEAHWTAGERIEVRLARTEAGGTVASGPGISVADAQVREAEGAMLAFRVTLDTAQGSAVSVRYGTSDGTAAAGTDYVARSGALRFAPGETVKTVSVPVLNDAHDEGSETLTLTLSHPFGAQLADGTATGTIVNTDPMPRAWITRFGRTVGGQVVEAVTARFEDDGHSHVTVGGMSLGSSGPYPAGRSDWNEWDTEMEPWDGAREMTERELLLGSSFHLSSRASGDGGPAFVAWGRVASDGFEADVDDVKVEGDVTTGLIGFDAEWDRMLAGLLLSQSRGEGSYTLDGDLGNDRGTVESTLTGLYPYARLEMSERVSVWGLAGIGSGELTLRQEGQTRIDTDLAMRMGAVGVKSAVLDGSGPSRVGLNVKSDAMWVRTESESAEGLESAEGDVTRLRLILEGERAFETGDGAAFTPTGQVGLRHDGGDAETGTGIEMGAGIRYTTGVLTIEGQVRALVAHEESGYEEWGASGAIRVSPGPSGRGLSLTLAPTWGQAASGTARLWSARDATALTAGEDVDAGGRLEATVGYGMPVAGGRFTGTPELGLGLSESGRDWRLGWRLGLAGSGRVDFGLGVEATRREPANDDAPENRIELTATMRW